MSPASISRLDRYPPRMSTLRDSQVYVVLTRAHNDDLEIELFGERPNTPGIGGEPDNWPDEYAVYVGNVDGGDSLLIEQDGAVIER